MNGRYNTRSPAVKRLMREAQELSEPTDQYFAQPLDDNLFEWHFTVRGPADSDFQNGIYHGRIILPVDYPMKPPSIIWLTPNGRFETNKKICLSISGHHPESWQPSWSIRTALLAIIGFMPTHPGGAIGSLDYTPDERKLLAKKSKDWKCATCGEVTGILLEVSENSEKMSRESKELAAQINLQGEKPKCKDGECPVEQARLAEMQSSATSTAARSLPSSAGTTTTATRGEAPAVSTANSNTSNPVPEGVTPLPAPTAMPFPPLPYPATLPQWPPGMNPFPPMGFPLQYPGMAPLSPMQFPYPPSHYSHQATPPNAVWPNLQGMGPFPASFMPPPPLIPSSPQVSTNNSSVQEESPSPGKKKAGSTVVSNSYVRSPMTCPPTAGQSPRSQSPTIASTASPRPTQQDMFDELLSKVKRVGSDPQQGQSSSLAGAESAEPQAENREGAAKAEECVHGERSEALGDQLLKGTDSDLSRSCKKTANKSVSEIGDTNTEDNSESGVPPIEGSDADQRFEKSACSSTSDLERGKQKSQSNKALRQRQSVPSGIPSDLSEEANVELDRSEASAGSGGQRIEAASGDTTLRNRYWRGAPRLENNRNAFAAVPHMNENVPRDASFYVMVGLLTTSVLILLNRLASIKWL